MEAAGRVDSAWEMAFTGGAIFDYTGGKFGPFAGQMFIGDQSRSNIMRVSLDKVGGEYQGVIFDFVNRLKPDASGTSLAKTEPMGRANRERVGIRRRKGIWPSAGKVGRQDHPVLHA